MKKVTTTLITVMLWAFASVSFAQLSTQPQWNRVLSDSPESFRKQLVSSSERSTVVNLQVPGFYTLSVITPRGEAKLVTMPKALSTAKAGEPDLPMTGIPVLIGDQARMGIRVLDAQYMDFEGIEVAPSKGDFSRQIDPATVPYTYGECYSQDAFFPASNVGLYEPYIVRDFRGQNMVLYPYAYNPVTRTLRVYYDMTVEMYKLDDNGANAFETRRSNTVKMSQDFKSLYQRHFINYEAAMNRYTPLDEEGDLLIICYDNFISSMTDFVNWKKTRGINTTIVGTSTAGSSYSAIKTYIQNQYNANNNISHVLLVGDVAQIPGYSYSGGGSSYGGKGDNAYGQIVGSDIYNDVIIGRFSASSASRVTTQCNRAITYERDLTTSASWLQKGEGISRKENGSGHNNEDDYQHINNIRTDLLNYGYTTVYQRYANLSGYDASASTISSDINSGVGIINYANHGQETAWGANSSGYVYYANSHVNALTNENKLPFIFSVACLVGKYDHSSDCFAEAWMNATNNNNPTGAIGTLMSYISQPWIPPMWAQDECIDILVGNSSTSTSQKYTYGGICINGLMGIFDHYSTSEQSAVGTYQAWIVYGDPTLMVRTKTPQSMTVTHSGSLPLGNTSYNVTVSNGNGAVATITDANHNILGKATVSNGSATINISGSLTANQQLTLCVFGYNKVTYLGTITVTGGTQYTIAANASPTAGGTISGAGQYYENTQCTLTATPNTGYEFTNWKKGNSVVSTNAAYTFTVSSSTAGTYTATFTAVQQYTITATASPTAGGTVTGSGAYNSGATCTLTATANTGYTFSKWTKNGTQVSTNATYSFTVSGDAEYVAVFTVKSYNVTATANPTAGGTVSGGGTYTHGSSCTLVATAATGYTFSKWTKNGTTASTNATYTFTVTEAAAYVAVFTINNYTVTATANPAEGGTVTVGSAKGDRDDLVYDFENGWQNWTTFQGSTTSPHSWMHNTEYTAYDSNGSQIVPECHNSSSGMMLSESYISASVSGGSGTAVTPDNYLVSPRIRLGGSITFYAAARMSSYPAEKFSVLVSESGNTSASDFTHTLLTVTLTSSTYSWNSYTVDLSAYSGMGYVAIRHYDCNDQHLLYVDDVTIVEGDDQSTDSGNFDHGETCVVTATPVGDYVFMNWTENGNVVSSDPTYTFTVTGNRNFVANFSEQTVTTYAVTATADPAEGGTVTGGGNYVEGATCTLTATANTGYTFTKWTKNGVQVSTNATYQFDVTEATAYVAHFTINSYAITATANPSAYGQVSGGGTYTYGSNCTLTATPSEGYHFVSWTLNGSVVSTSATYQFQVSGSGSYVANFEIIGYSVTATANPVEGGSVTGVGTYAHGTTCTLTAAPATGYHFVNWTLNGTEVGTSLTYQFEVTGDLSLVANFEVDSYEVTATADPATGGTVTGGGTYTYGSTCTLTATANTGYTFINWTSNNGVVSTEPSYNFDVIEGGSYVANFEEIESHTVTVNQVEGGTIYATPTTAYVGDVVTLTVNTNNGYYFVEWNVKDSSNNSISVTDNQFVMPNSNVTVTATFSQGFEVTLNQTPNGTINADKTTALQPGDVVTLTATPDANCIFEAWYVFKTGNPREVIAVVNNSYFVMPANDVTVMAVFVTEEEHEQTIGSGNSTNQYIPTRTNRYYSLSQQIYTANEIGYNGRITAIAFKANGTVTRTLDIYMAHTNKNAFTTTTSWGQTTSTDWEVMGSVALVYSGSVSFVNGWTTITLDTPFEYDGTRNLNICVADKTGSTGSSRSFSVYSTNAYRALYINSGSSSYSSGTDYSQNLGYPAILSGYSGTAVQSNNQIKFTIKVPGSAESLTVSPRGVNGLNYEEGNGPSDTHKLDIVGVDLNNDIILTAPENFEICETEAGTYGQSLTIPREGAKSRDVIHWGFEGTLDGWTAVDADGDGYNWVLSSASVGVYLAEGATAPGGHDSSTDMMVSGSYTNAASSKGLILNPDNWLISPQVTLGGSFSLWACPQRVAYPAEHFGIYVSTTNTNTSSFTMLNEWTISNTSWAQYSVDLSAFAGQTGYIAVRHFNCTDQFAIGVDDFVLDTDAAITIELPVDITAATVYVRMAAGLEAGSYDGTLTATAGQISKNVSLSGQVTLPTQTVSLVEGWNWWTPMLQASLGDLQTALNNSMVAIMPANTQVLEPGKMYKVQVSNDCSDVTLSGHKLTSVTVTIENGLNTFGYTGADEALIGEALNGLNPEEGDMINSFDEGFAIFNGQTWEGTLTTLRPGHAYEYLSKANGSKMLTF